MCVWRADRKVSAAPFLLRFSRLGRGKAAQVPRPRLTRCFSGSGVFVPFFFFFGITEFLLFVWTYPEPGVLVQHVHPDSSVRFQPGRTRQTITGVSALNRLCSDSPGGTHFYAHTGVFLTFKNTSDRPKHIEYKPVCFNQHSSIYFCNFTQGLAHFRSGNVSSICTKA